MQLDENKFKKVVKAIADMADSVDDIPTILVALARVPDEQWEQVIESGIHHRKLSIASVCSICSTSFEADSQRTASDPVCPRCRVLHRSEFERVVYHRGRAQRAGLTATLKLVEWLAARQHFSMLCAYCQVNGIEALDHFIPINLGGGSDASTVVPACEQCNRKKMYTHPNHVQSIPKDDLERVREYLNSQELPL